jgi:hypothetical protein
MGEENGREGAAAAPAISAEAFLGSLPDQLVSDPSLVMVQAAARRARGVEVGKGWPPPVFFTPPFDASKVAALLRLGGGLYVVSGDVHQRSWRLVVGGASLEDPHRPRISTELPKVGAWRLDLRVEGRPAGPLPTTMAGASPAYPLSGHSVSVTSLFFIRDP